MTSWRFCLLLLLAVLLPIRGAVAAAMPCPVGGSGMRTGLATGGPAGPHSTGHATGDATDHAATPAQMQLALAHDAAGAHDPAGAHHAHGAHTSGDGYANSAAGTEGCNACAASCSAAPLVRALPTMPAPLDPAAVEFAERPAPPPSHLVGGPERPPRGL